VERVGVATEYLRDGRHETVDSELPVGMVSTTEITLEHVFAPEFGGRPFRHH